MFINATGLTEQNGLTVEIVDEQFRPVAGYAAVDFVPIKEKSGLRLPMAWQGGRTLSKEPAPIRVRVNWTGSGAQPAKLFAIYVE